MHEQYLPTDLPSMQRHIAEEASEVITEYLKIQRFGDQSYDPADPEKKTNIQRFREELDDLQLAILRYLNEANKFD